MSYASFSDLSSLCLLEKADVVSTSCCTSGFFRVLETLIPAESVNGKEIKCGLQNNINMGCVLLIELQRYNPQY